MFGVPKLNNKQERAAYLASQGTAIQAIAKELDIAEETVSRWLQLPHFISVLNSHRQTFRAIQRNKLEFLSAKSMAVLEDILTSGTSVEKLRAAQIILDKVDLFQPVIEPDPLQNLADDASTPSPDEPAAANNAPLEHEPLGDIDETILEECLEDLHAYLEGEMPLEKAKARLYPVIAPAKLNLKSASALLPALKTQVDANQAKHLFVGKV